MKKTKLDPMLEKAMVRMGVDPKGHLVRRRRAEDLLAYRCRQYAIKPPTFHPIGDSVIVKRLPPLQFSASGIIIPEDAQSPHVKGILLAMGPKAMDDLAPIEVGHIVTWGRFAGAEGRDMGTNHYEPGEILMLKSKDIIGSDDLKEAIDSGRMRIIRGEGERHQFAHVSTKMLTAKESKRAKLERVAERTDNPHEAEAARRAAAGLK